MIFYFSGCGNSRYVGQTLSQWLNDTLYFIPEMARQGRYDYTLSEGEKLGFVFPVYSWAPPQLVLDFVKQLQLAEKPGYVYFACTCGDQCGQTEKIFRKALKEKGWDLHWNAWLQARHGRTGQGKDRSGKSLGHEKHPSFDQQRDVFGNDRGQFRLAEKPSDQQWFQQIRP